MDYLSRQQMVKQQMSQNSNGGALPKVVSR